MENDKPTILNQGMKFGLILGLTQIAISLLLYLIDKTLLVSMWVGFTILVISIVLMVLPVKSFKKMQGGIITFKDAFLVCLATVICSLLITSIFNFVLYNVIDPTLADFIKQESIEKMASFMEKFGTPAEEIDKAITKIEAEDMSMSPARIGKSFIFGILFSAVVALIIAAIIRTKTQPVDDTIA
jgi:tetrahydromethanopterin S-methyltransferase subunit G